MHLLVGSVQEVVLLPQVMPWTFWMTSSAGIPSINALIACKFPGQPPVKRTLLTMLS